MNRGRAGLMSTVGIFVGSLLFEFASSYYTFFFLLWQITVMIVTGVLVGFNLYGAVMLRQYFDQVWFLPPNSMGYKYTVTNSKVSLTPVLLLFLVI